MKFLHILLALFLVFAPASVMAIDLDDEISGDINLEGMGDAQGSAAPAPVKKAVVKKRAPAPAKKAVVKKKAPARKKTVAKKKATRKVKTKIPAPAKVRRTRTADAALDAEERKLREEQRKLDAKRASIAKRKQAEKKKSKVAKKMVLGQVTTAADVGIRISGQMRLRPEMNNNYDFDGNSGDSREFVGQRIRINAKIAVGETIDAFVQLQDTRYWGAVNAASQTGVNTIATGRENESTDFHQAWFKVKDVLGSGIDVKAGRQELVYGDQRLLGHLGWQDNGRAFDAFKGTYHLDNGSVDILYAKLKDTDTTGSTGDTDQILSGLYSQWNLMDQHTLDVYFLNWTDEANGRDMNTYGARFAGKTGPFDYKGEFAQQNGIWTKGATDVKQDAFAYAIVGGYTADYSWKSRIGFEYAYGTGDDGSDALKHKTFVFPFHTNHAHYGYMDMFSWGNVEDTAIKFSTNPMGSKMKVKLDYHILKLAEAKDAWHDVVGNPGTGFKAAGSYSNKDAGQEIDLTVVYPYNKHLKIVGGYSVFMPGKAVKERTLAVSGKELSTDANWGYLMMIMNF